MKARTFAGAALALSGCGLGIWSGYVNDVNKLPSTAAAMAIVGLVLAWCGGMLVLTAGAKK